MTVSFRHCLPWGWTQESREPVCTECAGRLLKVHSAHGLPAQGHPKFQCLVIIPHLFPQIALPSCLTGPVVVEVDSSGCHTQVGPRGWRSTSRRVAEFRTEGWLPAHRVPRAVPGTWFVLLKVLPLLFRCISFLTKLINCQFFFLHLLSLLKWAVTLDVFRMVIIFFKSLYLHNTATQNPYFVRHLRGRVAEVWRRETCSRYPD